MLTKHNNIKRILAVILAVLALVGGLYGICRAVRTARAYDVAPLTDAQLTDLDLTGITHLMIVAHPDDETLWGGAHIADGGYLVVCITNGNNPTRSAEFQSVMQASGNVGLILSYPDKVAGKRDNWNHVRTQIRTDLEKVMTYQPWEDIVTHNAKGEYGWSRDFDEIKATVSREMQALGTDYIDFGFLHCVDEDEDFDKLTAVGVWD